MSDTTTPAAADRAVADSLSAEIVPELLTTPEAAKLLNIGERTLWRHSRSGLAPAPMKIGGAVRYRRQELLDWIASGCPRVNRQKGG
jgi:excisionase family DNA binding protein